MMRTFGLVGSAPLFITASWGSARPSINRVSSSVIDPDAGVRIEQMHLSWFRREKHGFSFARCHLGPGPGADRHLIEAEIQQQGIAQVLDQVDACRDAR